MRIQDSYPLSPVQHGMIVHSLAAPDSGVYVQQLVCGGREELDVSAFQRAWQALVKRHEVFRTRFNWRVIEEPVQQVCENVELPFTYQDWAHASALEKKERLERFLRADRSKGFKIDEAPLMRLAVFRYDRTYYCWVWTSHHAVLDGRSRLVVLKELFALYQKFARGEPLYLKSPRPYREYIDWISRQDPVAAESFWRRSLSGFNPPTSLKIKCSSLDTREEKFGMQHLRLSKKLTGDLQSLAKQHRLTINTLLQGAWALLLSRYSGEEKVVFGATRAGRHSTPGGSASVVGPFINTLPVCVEVSPSSSLLEWLSRLRAQWIAMRDFEHIPLAQIQKLAQIPAGSRLFESLLTFENYQLSSAVQQLSHHPNIGEIRLIGTTNYPIAVTGYLGKEILLDVTYDRGRFDDGVVARMLGQLRNLLDGMVSRPAAPLADFPLLTLAERQQLLVQWNDTRRHYPKDQSVHELFERQAERTPDHVAVVFGDQRLTYRELNRKANQLAYYLRRHGVGPEVLVGICVERSLEMIVAVLGILKAGGAYLPLDPSCPPDRLDYMLRDVQAPVLLTQRRLQDKLFKDGRWQPVLSEVKGIADSDPPSSSYNLQVKVVSLDADWNFIAREPEDNLASTTTAENLAYVMYTSGSTGKPKGVCVTHGGVVRLVKETNYAELSEKEVFLQFAPLSFDASTFEIWAPLLNGAKLVVVPPHRPSLEELARTVQQAGITTLWLTSALFELLVEDHIQKLAGVKQLLAGGDVLSVRHVKKMLRELPGCRLINGYGPTENTTFTCCYPMTSVEEVGESVSIGRPIANTQVYLLDRYLNPVPIGVVGELYAGGNGLARGYSNNPELTAQKFLPHPFSCTPGERLYRTGDLARYLDDGNIEFLGRIDHQVKIRGFRIESEEIEAVLSQHPLLRQAVVVARNEVGAEKQLVAYAVRKQESAATVAELRAFLRRQLPDYMIPSSWVFLDALPLTPNGKVDPKALPAPQPGINGLGEGYVAPRTSTEQAVARIWVDLLKLERVGVEDNFFDLGGHSLLATQVLSRVREFFQVEMPLRTLFEEPSLEGFARAIAARKNSRVQHSSLPSITPLPRRWQPLKVP
jgi:amino acid adenylation domain-containing protein